MTIATVLMVDAEELVVNALLNMPELNMLGGRIYTVSPKARTFPMARITRFGGDPMWDGQPYWLDQPAMQADVWAQGGYAEAYGIAEQMRASLAQKLIGAWPEGVVTHVKTTALVATGDTDFDPPKPRYRFTVTLITHPLPSGITDPAIGGSPVDRRLSAGSPGRRQHT
jgi:hypothetical protein